VIRTSLFFKKRSVLFFYVIFLSFPPFFENEQDRMSWVEKSRNGLLKVFAGVSRTRPSAIFGPSESFAAFFIAGTIFLASLILVSYSLVAVNQNIRENSHLRALVPTLLCGSEKKSFNSTLNDLEDFKKTFQSSGIPSFDVGEQIAYVSKVEMSLCKLQAKKDASFDLEECLEFATRINNAHSKLTDSFWNNPKNQEFILPLKMDIQLHMDEILNETLTQRNTAVDFADKFARGYGTMISRVEDFQSSFKQSKFGAVDADLITNHAMGVVSSFIKSITPGQISWTKINFVSGLIVVWLLGLPGLSFLCYSFLSNVHYLHSLTGVKLNAFGEIVEEVLATESSIGYVFHVLSYKSLCFMSLLLFTGILYEVSRHTSGFYILAERFISLLEKQQNVDLPTEPFWLVYIVRPAKVQLRDSRGTLWTVIATLTGIQLLHGFWTAFKTGTNPLQLVSQPIVTSFTNPYIWAIGVFVITKYTKFIGDESFSWIKTKIDQLHGNGNRSYISFALAAALVNWLGFSGLNFFVNTPGIVTPEENLVVATITEAVGHLFNPSGHFFTQ